MRLLHIFSTRCVRTQGVLKSVGTMATTALLPLLASSAFAAILEAPAGEDAATNSADTYAAHAAAARLLSRCFATQSTCDALLAAPLAADKSEPPWAALVDLLPLAVTLPPRSVLLNGAGHFQHGRTHAALPAAAPLPAAAQHGEQHVCAAPRAALAAAAAIMLAPGRQELAEQLLSAEAEAAAGGAKECEGLVRRVAALADTALRALQVSIRIEMDLG